MPRDGVSMLVGNSLELGAVVGGSWEAPMSQRQELSSGLYMNDIMGEAGSSSLLSITSDSAIPWIANTLKVPR